MRKMSDTVARLAAMRAAAAATGGGPAIDRLHDFGDFGANPGKLRARAFRPEVLPARAPLVVVLHGCTQSAAGYDDGTGWSSLAEAHGFALLFPEQTRANNANLCFNWFRPSDTSRGHGEAESIREMVAAMVATYGLDPARVFVTGLSAGGGMASALLGAYPDVFAGGAIIAGLAAGSATSVPEAFDRMRGAGGPDAATLAARVQRARPGQKHWPRVSIWTGDADQTVAPVNADLLAEQWCRLHGLAAAPKRQTSAGICRDSWRGADGEVKVERITIPGLGHGAPIDGRDSQAAPFLIDVGVSSSRHIAAFFDVAGPAPAFTHFRAPAPAGPTVSAFASAATSGLPGSGPGSISDNVARTIDAALRSAGLRGGE